MVVGVCNIELDLPGIHSLKQKRSALKSLIAGVHRKFNVSCAEIALHDAWQSATIGVAVMTNDVAHAQRVLETVVYWIETNRPDLTVLEHDIEIIH